MPTSGRNDALSAAIADDEAGVSKARVTLSDMTLYVDGSWEGWSGDTMAVFGGAPTDAVGRKVIAQVFGDDLGRDVLDVRGVGGVGDIGGACPQMSSHIPVPSSPSQCSS
jgi:hypothetical protein